MVLFPLFTLKFAAGDKLYIQSFDRYDLKGVLTLKSGDEGSTMAWEAAKTACSNRITSTPVTSSTWLLASKDQWDYLKGVAATLS